MYGFAIVCIERGIYQKEERHFSSHQSSSNVMYIIILSHRFSLYETHSRLHSMGALRSLGIQFSVTRPFLLAITSGS